MSLYVAVYDIHPGDRRHFERLLTRISDNRQKESDILYIESFGSIDSLHKTMQKFDVIIIDACSDDDWGNSNIQIAKSIRDEGVNVPIALFLPENAILNTELKLSASSLENIAFFNKSIKTEDLNKIIRRGFEYQFAKAPKIELRDANKTIFVLPDDILYAQVCDSFMNVSLKDKSIIRIIKNLSEFILDINSYPQYLQANKNTIININHVSQKKTGAFLMDDGAIISYSFFDRKRVERAYAKFRELQ